MNQITVYAFNALMMSPKPATARRSYLPQLDGLRGLAIAAVAFHHFGFHPPSWIDWGPIGPTVFFLLSGYLITLSLEKMRANAGPGGGIFGGRLWEFHARRMARLLPLVVILLAIGVAVGLPGYRENWPWHVTFASNFYLVVHDQWAGSLSHLWSLSMQEQFYLLWPLVLCVPGRFLPAALAGVMALALGFRLACIGAGASDFTRWFLLPGSLDAFAMGGLIAWLTMSGRAEKIARGSWRWPIGILAFMALILGRYFRFLPDTNFVTAIIESLECVFFGWLLLGLVASRDGWLPRALSWEPLRFVGSVSYGIFIFHVLVGLALGRILAAAGVPLDAWPFLRASLYFAASVGVAALSWRWLEQPINRWVREASFDPSRWMEALRGWRPVALRLLPTPRWSVLTASLVVGLALVWAQPLVRSNPTLEDSWTIYKTTLGDDADEYAAWWDLAQPLEINNAPSPDESEPPSA